MAETNWGKWIVVIAGLVIALIVANNVLDLGLEDKLGSLGEGRGQTFYGPRPSGGTAEIATGVPGLAMIMVLVVGGIIALIIFLLFRKMGREPGERAAEEEGAPAREEALLRVDDDVPDEGEEEGGEPVAIPAEVEPAEPVAIARVCNCGEDMHIIDLELKGKRWISKFAKCPACRKDSKERIPFRIKAKCRSCRKRNKNVKRDDPFYAFKWKGKRKISISKGWNIYHKNCLRQLVINGKMPKDVLKRLVYSANVRVECGNKEGGELQVALENIQTNENNRYFIGEKPPTIAKAISEYRWKGLEKVTRWKDWRGEREGPAREEGTETAPTATGRRGREGGRRRRRPPRSCSCSYCRSSCSKASRC